MFRNIAPTLDMRWWDEVELDPADIDDALVWQPEPGRLAAMPNLRAIFSVGARVDHITSDPSWPKQVPLVRMFSPGFAQRMSEYVCLAALALLKDLPRNIAARAAHRRDSFTPGTVTGTRVGIMGLGNLGRHAAGMLMGFGLSVAGWSTSHKTIPGVDSFVGPGELGAFFETTNTLVCLLPDTPNTKHLIVEYIAGAIAGFQNGKALPNIYVPLRGY